MTSEHPELIQVHSAIDSERSLVASDLRTQGNLRICREFEKIHSLYQNAHFMNPKAHSEVKDQIHTSYLAREICKSNGF